MKLELCQPVQVVAAAEGEAPSRTIMGLAVPWNVTAYASTGPVRFLPGSIPTDGKAPKLIRNHDLADPIGIVTERVATDDGILFSARISETVTGNEALTLAADGVLDAVSVGVDVLDHEYDGNVMVVKSSRWRELSMVTFGAFEEAVITTVAAEADPELDSDNPDPDNPETETQPEKEDTEVSEATIPTAPLAVSAAPAYTRPRVTAADYISAMLTGKPLPEVRAADNELAQVPGLLPEPLIGDVWTTEATSRPIIDAVGTRALPLAGETFFRRYIQQTTSVAQQAAEFDPLASAQFQVSRIQVDKKTFGGYLNVSSQSGDWSEPALVQQIVNDMVRQYSKATEAYVGSVISTASVSATTTITTPTDGDEVIAALYDGAAQMSDNTGVLPTHLMVSTSVWAKFGQAKDAGGNRIFPYLGPVNAAGTSVGVANFGISPLGLNLVVTNDLGGGDQAMLVYGPAIEVYEDRSRTGGIRVENPATASATIGLWGYVGACVLEPLATATSGYVLYLI